MKDYKDITVDIYMSITNLHHALLGCKKSKQRDNYQKEPKIFIYGVSVEYITVWFQIVILEVQTFARSLVVEQPTGCCRLLREGGNSEGPTVGFPSAMCIWGGDEEADGTL